MQILFIAAAEVGNLAAVQLELQRGVDVDLANKPGDTALMLAGYQGHTDVFNALIVRGADVNIANNAGYTALMSAGYWGHIDIANTFLTAGAEVSDGYLDGNSNGAKLIKKCLDQRRARIKSARN